MRALSAPFDLLLFTSGPAVSEVVRLAGRQWVRSQPVQRVIVAVVLIGQCLADAVDLIVVAAFRIDSWVSVSLEIRTCLSGSGMLHEGEPAEARGAGGAGLRSAP